MIVTQKNTPTGCTLMENKEVMQMALETLDNMVKVDWHEWDEFASVEDFVRWAKSRASFTAEALRTALTTCERCGKKLGTKVTDIHTCTPKEIQPVARLTRDRIDGCWYATNKKESSNDKPLYTAPQKKEWVGLTDENIFSLLVNLQEMYVRPPTTDSRFIFARAIEAKLKEKNDG